MAKIAMITGASAGIGEACAEIFAKNGYNLILSARRYGRLEKLSKRLSNDYGILIQIMEVDVQNREDVINNGGKLPEEWRHVRSEEHTSELQSLMRKSYAVFCLKKKTKTDPLISQ